MIDRVTIENFKSIRKLNLELGRINVFIGENGSGKSNILEGVAIGAAAVHNKLANESISPRGVRIPAEEFFYFDSNETRKSEISFFKKSIFVSAMIELKGSIRTKQVTTADLPLPSVDEKNFHERYIEVLEKTIPDFMIFCPENYFLRRFEDESQILPLGIRGEGLFSLLQKMPEDQLVEVIDNLRLLDWFDGFEIPRDLFIGERRLRIKDRFIPGSPGFDQRSANEGFLFLLFYSALFISPETPEFFAIDNVENALNPKLCREVVRRMASMAKAHDKQAILTTHNPAVLDGLNLNDEEQRLFVVSRGRDGSTRVDRVRKPQPLPGKPLTPLSELFLRGTIGGLPKNF